MLKDITLGQYFPGTSPLHRMDPRTKLLMLVVYIVALFTAGGWAGYGVCFAFLTLVIAISRIPLKALFHGLKPLVFVLVLQQLEGNLIYPRVVGNSIGLPALWVLAAITVGGSLMGITGMLLGVPFAAAMYRLLKENVTYREKQKIAE